MDEVPETEVLEDAIGIVYDRPDTHGEPENSFQTIADKWSAHIRALLKECEDIDEFELEPADVANMMIDLKTSRNAEGHYHEDNYTDIAGYAENGAKVEAESMKQSIVPEGYEVVTPFSIGVQTDGKGTSEE